MAVTRLQRKVKKNRIKAKQRKAHIKQLLSKPVIKNIDINAIKAAFMHKKEEKTTPSA